MPRFIVYGAGAIGGRQSWVGKAGQVLDALSGPRSCAILFSDAKADPVRAAYQNGVIAGSLDWDDSHIAAIIHPGIVIWPAAFAAADRVGATRIVRLGVRRVVAALAVGAPDRMDRGEVDHVEAEVGDLGKDSADAVEAPENDDLAGGVVVGHRRPGPSGRPGGEGQLGPSGPVPRPGVVEELVGTVTATEEDQYLCGKVVDQ